MVLNVYVKQGYTNVVHQMHSQCPIQLDVKKKFISPPKS